MNKRTRLYSIANRHGEQGLFQISAGDMVRFESKCRALDLVIVEVADRPVIDDFELLLESFARPPSELLTKFRKEHSYRPPEEWPDGAPHLNLGSQK